MIKLKLKAEDILQLIYVDDSMFMIEYKDNKVVNYIFEKTEINGKIYKDIEGIKNDLVVW